MSIPPGSTIGIIGGGQLGRMLAIAAAHLGYRTAIYAPGPSGPAPKCRALDAATMTISPRSPPFAQRSTSSPMSSRISTSEPIQYLAHKVPSFRPRARSTAQDRATEKSFVEAAGRPSRALAQGGPASTNCRRWARSERPAILKTRRFGYDGKGQERLKDRRRRRSAGPRSPGAGASSKASSGSRHEFSIILVRGAWTARWSAGIRRPGTSMRRHPRSRRSLPRVEAARRTAAKRLRWPNGRGYARIMSACWRCEFFATATARCSTRWRRASTIRAIGRSRARSRRSSRIISGRSAACRLGSTGLIGRRVEMREPDWRRRRERWPTILAEPDRAPPSLRQERREAGPQDGACDQGVLRLTSRHPSESWDLISPLRRHRRQGREIPASARMALRRAAQPGSTSSASRKSRKARTLSASR
jgi:5-(carboxyamino)imidazole ribonucleotide synthase